MVKGSSVLTFGRGCTAGSGKASLEVISRRPANPKDELEWVACASCCMRGKEGKEGSSRQGEPDIVA